MKNLIVISLLLIGLLGGTVSAQKSNSGESFGNTLNLGLGLGYYGYVGQFMPAVSVNYEIQLANDFTLAPFITVFSYRNNRNWENRKYYYRQTAIPVGVKGTYYFDRLLGLDSKWDLYGAGSLGFTFKSTTWDDGYGGDIVVRQGRSPLYLNAHLGAEYHLKQNLGLYLDLSTGLSTVGLAFHL